MNRKFTLLLALLMTALISWPALAEEAPAAPEATAEAALSDDLYSFQLELCGDVITLPMKVSDFIALGWQSKDCLLYTSRCV